MKIFEAPLWMTKSAAMTIHSKNDIGKNLKHRVPWIERGVGVVPINGILMNEDSWVAEWMGGRSYQDLRTAIENFETDDEIKAILLDVNSVGGDAMGCSELAEYIKAIQKPVITYVSGESYSAGYYLTAAADHIICHKTGAVGSIGTVILTQKQDGEIFIVSSQSPLKVPDVTSDEGQAQIRVRLDSLTNEFIKDVAVYRSKDTDFVAENFGRGDIVAPEQALKVGMIDAIGNFKSAIKMALDIVGGSVIEANENKTRSRGSKMGLKKTGVKQELVIVDSDTLTEDVPMEAVTKEFIEENFPEIAEEFREEGRASASEEAQEVDEVAADAHLDDEEEMAIITQARQGKITAAQAAQKILQVRSKKEKEAAGKPENKSNQMLSLLQKRGEDQPGVATAGSQTEMSSVGQKTIDAIKARRGRK